MVFDIFRYALLFCSALIFHVLPMPHDSLHFVEEPKTKYLDDHVELSFKCRVHPNNAVVTWYRNEKAITRDSPFVEQLSKHKIIVHENGTDLGLVPGRVIYRCKADLNSVGIISSPAELLIPYLTNFVKHEDIHVSGCVGNTVVIPCGPLPLSFPEAVSIITFNGKSVINRSHDRYVLARSGNLYIKATKVTDSGVYQCFAHNPFLEKNVTAPYRIFLTVQHSCSDIPNDVFLVQPFREVTAVMGSDVQLECLGSDDSDEVDWHRNGGDLPYGRHTVNEVGTLIITTLQMKDAGNYVCSVGNLTDSTRLIVHEPPQVAHQVHEIHSDLREELNLECGAKGVPSPNISWYLNGNLISPATHKGISIDEYGLHIRRVNKHHRGIFQCFATNLLKTVSARFVVHLPSTRRFRNGTEIRHRNRQGMSDGLPIFADDGTDHTTSTDIPFNVEVKVIVPSRPEVTALSETSVMLHWSLRSPNDGLPIRFFRVQYKIPGEKLWKTIDEDIAPGTRAYQVTGLSPETVYKFRIAASYSNLDNKAGPTSKAFQLKRTSVGGASGSGSHAHKLAASPVIGRLEPISSVAFEVQWKYDMWNETNGFIVYYRPTESGGDYTKVVVGLKNSTTVANLPPGVFSYQVGDLRPHTAYDVKMAAVGITGGSSPFSKMHTVKTLKGTESVYQQKGSNSVKEEEPNGSGLGAGLRERRAAFFSEQDIAMYAAIILSVIAVGLLFGAALVKCAQEKKKQQIIAKEMERQRQRQDFVAAISSV